jgi:spermidine synthase
MKSAGYILLLGMVVTGSLLTFSLEPLTGRMITPFFGGAIHVWTVSVMVFQGLLFAAYLYAHLLARRIGPLHIGVVLLPLAFLPLEISAIPHPDAPVVALIVDLLRGVGVPFFALATTSVVAQYWLVSSDIDREPWSLYAASNVGSLVALLAYPFVLEPIMGVAAQGTLWTGLYVVHCALCIAAWRALRPSGVIAEVEDSPAPTALDYGRWIALSAGPSTLLLAITNVITSELGSFPLFWVMPLALYLGSFIMAFRDHEEPGYLAEFWPDLLLGLALMCQFVILAEMQPPLYAAFFGICWVAHEQLYLSRPAPRHLTAFYLAIALGGWIGGIAVSVVAPVLFDRLAEVPIAMFLVAAAILWVGGRPSSKWWKEVHIRYSGSRAILGGTVLVLTVLLLANEGQKGFVDRERNLYGIFTLAERTADNGHRYRELASGQTAHGKQYLDGPNTAVPMSYYHPAGPNHAALSLRKPGRMAGIGLGAGAIAAMLEPGEQLVFYEINPTSERMAREWFTYLSDSPGEVEVRIGDARLLLATEADEAAYDALFVDAFVGDGIPTHLLTVEAFRTYLDRLAEDGILVLHISNRYYDLRGVLATTAASLDLAGVSYMANPDGSESDEPLYDPATTVALSRDPAVLKPLLDAGWQDLADHPRLTLWTDDYIDIIAAMRARSVTK